MPRKPERLETPGQLIVEKKKIIGCLDLKGDIVWGNQESTLNLCADKIRFLMGRSVNDIILLGAIFTDLSKYLKGKGYRRWLAKEFSEGFYRTAYRFVAVYNKFGKIDNAGFNCKVQPSALYLLAQSSTPESIIKELQTTNSRVITHQLVKSKLEKYKEQTPARKVTKRIGKTATRHCSDEDIKWIVKGIEKNLVEDDIDKIIQLLRPDLEIPFRSPVAKPLTLLDDEPLFIEDEEIPF